MTSARNASSPVFTWARVASNLAAQASPPIVVLVVDVELDGLDVDVVAGTVVLVDVLVDVDVVVGAVVLVDVDVDVVGGRVVLVEVLVEVDVVVGVVVLVEVAVDEVVVAPAKERLCWPPLDCCEDWSTMRHSTTRQS